MRPLIGLPDHYNRTALILAKTLPQPRVSDDPLMQLLHVLDSINKGVLAEALDPLRKFVDASENLLKSDYGPITSLQGTSLKELWLPVLLLGRNWSQHVESLVGIPATSWDNVRQVEAIILTPVIKRENPKLRVRLYNHLTGIHKEQYKDFESSIKTPFGLRTSYKRIENRIEIDFLDETSRIIDATEEDAERMLQGNLPTWLCLLLKWDAVERIELNYRHESGDDVKNQVSAVVAIPECPASISSSSQEASIFLDHCLTWLGVPDSRSKIPSPVFVVLSSLGEEWYRLLDTYCVRLERFLREECGLDGIADEESAFVNHYSPLLLSLIERRLAFPLDADLRPENDFSAIAPLFNFDNDGEKGKIQERFALANDHDISNVIQNKIGVVVFLIQLAETLKIRCDQLINLPKTVVIKKTSASQSISLTEHKESLTVTLDKEASSPSSRKNLFFSSAIEKLTEALNPGAPATSALAAKPPYPSAPNADISQSLDTMTTLTTLMFQVFLGIFLRNLDVAIEVMRLFSCVNSDSPKAAKFSSIAGDDKDGGLFSSLSHLLHVSIHGSSVNERSLALAGALYVLDANGVSPDDGPGGRCDDEFCTASALIRLEEGGLKLTEEISEWAFDYKANIDSRLSMEKQRQVLSAFDSYLSLLEKTGAS